MIYTPSEAWRQQQWREIPLIGQVDRLYIHHGAAGNPNIATAQAYERFHVINQGNRAIGYPWLVTLDRILEGRGWFKAGAHTLGWNFDSSAICIVGDWSNRIPPASVVDLIVEIIRHGIAVGALTNPVRIIDGHRNAPGNSTSCPGDGGMSIVPAIRQRVAAGPQRIITPPRRFPRLTMRELMILLGKEEDMLVKSRSGNTVFFLHDGKMVGLKGPRDKQALEAAHVPYVVIEDDTFAVFRKAFHQYT